MKFQKIAALALSIAMIGSLAACGGDTGPAVGGGDTGPAGAGDDKTAGGTPTEQITMPNGDVLDSEQYYNGYLFSEPATLDSTKSSDSYGGTILNNVMEPLTRLGEDEDGKSVLLPAAAKSWSSNEEGSVWTFVLGDSLWSDGVPVKAQDFVYGIQRVLNPETGSPTSYLLMPLKNAAQVNSGTLPVEELGVKALDDKTLEITLEAPTPYFLSLTYNRCMFPVRQDIVEQYGDTYGAEIDTMVFNGPFVMSTWVHNSEITLAKNVQYWDKDSVYLTDVTYKILNDESAIFNSFDNGSLDSCSSGTPEWIDKFTNKEGVSPIYYVTPSIRFNFYNTNDPIFSNQNMRQAFSLAINREDMARAVYFDTMLPSYSWVPQGVSVGDLGDYRTMVSEPLKDFQTENSDAKALLLKGMEELGLGSDPSTLDITFSFGDTNQWIRNYGEYLQQTLKTNLGLQMKLDFNEWPSFQSKINSGDYQIGYMVWGIDYNEPMSMLELMTSYSGSIPTGWVNEEYDSLIGQASVEMDEAKRLELYQQAEQILMEEAPLAPLVNETYHGFYNSCVKGYATNYFTSTGLKTIYISGR